MAFLFIASTNAQSTYQQVYKLFQTKCTASCHSGGTPSGNLDLSLDSATVYSHLVNGTPTNPAAASAGLKLVTPGYPYRSYLLKKVNHGLDPQNDLNANEGNAMPNVYQTSLSKKETELIRQWIIWGAPDTGKTYNINLVDSFYTVGGTTELAAPLTPVQEGREGYQVKFGPIFLQPQSEFEFFQVYNPNLSSDKEITEFTSKVPAECHHWALRTISQAGATAMGVAPQPGANFSTQILVYQYTKFLAIWQFSDSLKLPAGTAHFQNSAEALLLNLHLHNSSPDSIIAASAYVNIYTQPMGSGAVQMKTDLASYGGTNPFLLQIPPTGLPDTLSFADVSPAETRYYWNIQSHTHSRGTAYNMFLRNPNGTKGAQIYDGDYNENYSFNQGYYDYSHPAVRTFNPMMQVDMTNGIIFEATWVNHSPDTIPFGLTTAQEMFVAYFQYTNQIPTGIKNITGDNGAYQLYPNPAASRLFVESKGSPISEVNIYNGIGGIELESKQSQIKSIDVSSLANGIYIAEIKSADGIERKRWVKM